MLCGFLKQTFRIDIGNLIVMDKPILRGNVGVEDFALDKNNEKNKRVYSEKEDAKCATGGCCVAGMTLTLTLMVVCRGIQKCGEIQDRMP